MASAGVEAEAGRATAAGPQRWAAVTAAAGVAGMVASFVAVALLVSLPGPFRLAVLSVACLLAILAVGLWHRVAGAIAFGVVIGGFVVFAGVQGLLALGDDVYERLPQAVDAWAPALALVLGATALVGSAASVPAAGRIGRWVALLALVAGLALVAMGARWLLEVHPLTGSVRGFTGGESTCGSAFRPNGASSAQGCWEVVVDARDDGRMAMAMGGALAVLGLGMVVGQFGRRAWPLAAIGLGSLALALAVWLRTLPLQSRGCSASYEEFAGPVCDGLRAARTVLWSGLLAMGVALVAGGGAGLVSHRRRRYRHEGDPAPDQVRA